MLTIHQILGLSDAMGAAPAKGERHSLLYNMLMVLTFYLASVDTSFTSLALLNVQLAGSLANLCCLLHFGLG